MKKIEQEKYWLPFVKAHQNYSEVGKKRIEIILNGDDPGKELNERWIALEKLYYEVLKSGAIQYLEEIKELNKREIICSEISIAVKEKDWRKILFLEEVLWKETEFINDYTQAICQIIDALTKEKKIIFPYYGRSEVLTEWVTEAFIEQMINLLNTTELIGVEKTLANIFALNSRDGFALHVKNLVLLYRIKSKESISIILSYLYHPIPEIRDDAKDYKKMLVDEKLL